MNWNMDYKLSLLLMKAKTRWLLQQQFKPKTIQIQPALACLRLYGEGYTLPLPATNYASQFNPGWKKWRTTPAHWGPPWLGLPYEATVVGRRWVDDVLWVKSVGEETSLYCRHHAGMVGYPGWSQLQASIYFLTSFNLESGPLLLKNKVRNPILQWSTVCKYFRIFQYIYIEVSGKKNPFKVVGICSGPFATSHAQEFVSPVSDHLKSKIQITSLTTVAFILVLCPVGWLE